MTIGRDAPVACASGSRECWEAFASERSALARYKSLSGGRNGAATTNFGKLIDLALTNEGPARTALKETAYFLGIGIANLIRGLAPQAVIVGGPIVRAWPVISTDIRTTVEATICRGLPTTRIIASTLGPEPTLMGALSLVLASKFASVTVT
jgi:predicted NBD/HSP70 family sugar kinase